MNTLALFTASIVAGSGLSIGIIATISALNTLHNLFTRKRWK